MPANFEETITFVKKRVKEKGYGCTFSYEEIIKHEPFKDVAFEFDTLNSQLVIEHNIFLTSMSEISGFKATVPSPIQYRVAINEAKQGSNEQ